MENEHGPCALADDEVALPMADLSSGIGVLGPFVDGDAILDRISRRPRSERTPAFVTSREITPQLLGLLGGAVDEGVDRLAPGMVTPMGKQRIYTGPMATRKAPLTGVGGLVRQLRQLA